MEKIDTNSGTNFDNADYASSFRRVLALILDSVLFFVFAYTFGYLLSVSGLGAYVFGLIDTSSTPGINEILLLAVIYGFYQMIFYALPMKGTIAYYFLKCKIVNKNSFENCSIFKIFVRGFLFVAGLGIVLSMAGQYSGIPSSLVKSSTAYIKEVVKIEPRMAGTFAQNESLKEKTLEFSQYLQRYAFSLKSNSSPEKLAKFEKLTKLYKDMERDPVVISVIYAEIGLRLFLYMLSIWWWLRAAINVENRTYHDSLTGTRVILRNKKD